MKSTVGQSVSQLILIFQYFYQNSQLEVNVNEFGLIHNELENY